MRHLQYHYNRRGFIESLLDVSPKICESDLLPSLKRIAQGYKNLYNKPFKTIDLSKLIQKIRSYTRQNDDFVLKSTAFWEILKNQSSCTSTYFYSLISLNGLVENFYPFIERPQIEGQVGLYIVAMALAYPSKGFYKFLEEVKCTD